MSDEAPLEEEFVLTPAQEAFWRETLNRLTERIQQDPTNADPWIRRGILLTHLKKFEPAERDFREALRISPVSVWAISGLGKVFLEAGQYPEAIATFERAVTLAPAAPRRYVDRARGYWAAGRTSEAISDLTTAIRLDPTKKMPYYWRAMIRLEESVGDDSGALEDIDDFFRVQRHCPGDLLAEAHSIRARAFRHLGMYQEAILESSAEIELCPRNPLAYFDRSRAYEMVGDRERAIEDRKIGLELEREEEAEGTGS